MQTHIRIEVERSDSHPHLRSYLQQERSLQRRVPHRTSVRFWLMGDDAREVLRKHWGHHDFRGVQREAVDALVRGEDVFVRMATGGGKSACFQVAGVLRGGLTIVVSPLISLIHDQVSSLCARGIGAVALRNGDEAAWRSVREGHSVFLYVTPELVATDRFRESASNLDVRLLAIDEAHCVSEWGHEFRPDYKSLHALRELYPNAPIIALTATATRAAQVDIVRSLCLRRPCAQLATTVDRPNLVYAVHTKPSITEFASVVASLARSSASSIVYTPTVREAEAVYEALARIGVRVALYHAQMDPPEARQETYERFMSGSASVVVATLAFGMGVDKPDVRQVHHWGPCKSLEAYYQQAGRAGRDGALAYCTLWVAPSDWARMQHLLSKGTSEGDERERASFRAMRAYAEVRACRRRALASYFGDQMDKCSTCDVCTAPPAPKAESQDVAHDVRLLLEAVRDCGGHFGAATVIDVLHGTSERYAQLTSKPSYGRGAHLSKVAARRLLDELKVRGLILDVPRRSRGGHSYSALQISSDGTAWLDDEDASLLIQTRSASSCSHDALYARLSEVRARVRSTRPEAPSLTNTTLRAVARLRPSRPYELLQAEEASMLSAAQINVWAERLTYEVRMHAREWGDLLPDGTTSFPWTMLSPQVIEAVYAARPTCATQLLAIPGVPSEAAQYERELCGRFRSKYFSDCSSPVPCKGEGG